MGAKADVLSRIQGVLVHWLPYMLNVFCVFYWRGISSFQTCNYFFLVFPVPNILP